MPPPPNSYDNFDEFRALARDLRRLLSHLDAGNVSEIASLTAVRDAIGTADSLASTVGGSGAVTAKLRLLTSQLDVVTQSLSSIEGDIGATGVAAAGIGASGSISAKLRLVTSQLDAINTHLSSLTVTVSGEVDVTPAAPLATSYLPVRLTNGTSFYSATGGAGGGADIQYVDGDVDIAPTGNVILWRDAGDVLRSVTAAKPLPISAASLPLPSGAATEATLALLVRRTDTLGVSGTITATQSGSWSVTADTELPAAATLGDAATAISTPIVGAVGYLWDGTNYIRHKGDTASGAWVNIKNSVLHVDDNSGSLTVDGTITATQSGTWTVQQGTPPWSVSQSGAWTVGVTGTPTVDVTPSSPAANDYLPVRLTDGSAFYTAGGSSGGSAQYLEGATAASATGTLILYKTGSVMTAASVATPLPIVPYATIDDTGPFVAGDGDAVQIRANVYRALHVQLRNNSATGIVFPDSLALSDTLTNPTTTRIGAALLGWNSGASQWFRVPGTAANGVVVDVSRVQGTTAVSGTLSTAQSGTWNVTADTELPTAALLSDSATAFTTPTVGAVGYVWDGTNYIRGKGDTASGAWVNVKNPSLAVTQSGAWNTTLGTGANTIGKVDQGASGASAWKVAATDSIGQNQYNFPAGFVRTTDEPHQVFYDPFDSILDTNNRWNRPECSGGGDSPALNSGKLTLGTGTTAGGYSNLSSQPTFTPTVPSWLGFSFAIKIESAVTTGAYRFWGIGTTPDSPTASAPLTNAVGFELATDGKLYAVVYVAGVRTVVQDLSSATGNSEQPSDNNYHRYIVYYRTDRTYWYVDSLDTAAASSSFQSPALQTLPLRLLAVAGSTPPVSSGVLDCTGLAVWDTGKNNFTLSDGAYGWRKATVSSSGGLRVEPVGPLEVTSSQLRRAIEENTLHLAALIEILQQQ